MFIAEKSALVAALGQVIGAIERRNTIPILANVLLAPEDDGVRLTGTDLDIEISVRMVATSEAFEALTVPAAMLNDIVRKLPDGPVRFERSKSDVVVKSGGARFALHTLPASDMPTMDGGTMPAGMDIDADAFAAGLAGVDFAISTEETRFYLNGVYLHRTAENALTLVATDGHRLARRGIDLGDGTEIADFNGIIIPRKTCGLIKKLAEKHDRLRLEISDNRIRVSVEGAMLISKLIDGTFPDYQRVIPERFEKTVTVVKSDLRAAVDRVMTVQTDKGNCTKFDFSDGKLLVSASSADAGSGEEDLACRGDAKIEIGFNGKYVVAALEAMDGEAVEFRLTDSGSPTILRRPGAGDDLIVLMPMRV